jgi:stage II sporulation protein D
MNGQAMRRIVPGVLVAAFMLGLATCQESTGPGDGGIAPPPTQPAPRPRDDGPAYPTPIKLEKPRMLGPATPAIIVLQAKLPEPEIRVRLTEEQDSPPLLRRASYRGKVEAVKLPDGKYIGLNTLPLDSYLQGVLAKELYGSWDIEAYRAQAIAARTYALYQILAGGSGKPWDVTCDEGSQMYGGIAGETSKSRQAVSETGGQVLETRYGDQTGIFCAFYSACHGGATQDPFEAWGDYAVAPLAARKVGPVDAACPKYTWPTMTLSKSDVSRCIHNWGQHNGWGYLVALGPIQSAVIRKRNAATGRPVEITLTDVRGKMAPIRAEEFRLALVYDPAGSAPKPFSSWFEIRDAGPSLLLVNGRGYGHGIGMSQWGAQALAASGRSYKQILGFYYPGALIRALW